MESGAAPLPNGLPVGPTILLQYGAVAVQRATAAVEARRAAGRREAERTLASLREDIK